MYQVLRSLITGLAISCLAWDVCIAADEPVYSPQVPFLVQHTPPTVINGVMVVGHEEPVWVNPDSVPFVHGRKTSPAMNETLNGLASSVDVPKPQNTAANAASLKALQAQFAQHGDGTAVPPGPGAAPKAVPILPPVASSTAPKVLPKETPKPAAAAPAAPMPTVYRFHAEKNIMLSRMLSIFLHKYHWHLAWKSGRDFPISEAYTIDGTSVQDTVDQITKLYGLNAKGYINHVIRITDPVQKLPDGYGK